MPPLFGLLDVTDERGGDTRELEQDRRKGDIASDSPSDVGKLWEPGAPSSKSSKGKRKATHLTNEDQGNAHLKDSPDELAATQTPLKARASTKIIVALDFGTTYTGFVVTCVVSKKEAGGSLHPYTEWPGRAAANIVKAPTRIAYASENKAWGSERLKLANDVFGYEVEPEMKSYTWFKLLLDEDAIQTQYDDPHLRDAAGIGKDRLPEGKSAEEVSADFLRHIRKLIDSEIAKYLAESSMQRVPIHFVVTVPAVWSEPAKQRTWNALTRAGYLRNKKDKLQLVSEPEAAIMECAISMRDRVALNLQKYQRIMIVDGGGGTIDIASMEVVTVKPLKLKHICANEGGKCGATMIDRELVRFLTSRFGEAYTSISKEKKGIGSVFMNAFEMYKNEFTGDERRGVQISFPALGANIRKSGLKFEGFNPAENVVRITIAEMVEIFNRTLKSLIELTERQIERVKEVSVANLNVDVILLCGGMAASPYIWKMFKAHFGNRKGEPYKVLRPDLPWAAIFLGAARIGMEQARVVERVFRGHYGLQVHRAVKKGEIVEKDDRYTCPIHGERVKGAVYWFACKGLAVDPKKKNRISGYIVLDDEEEFVWEILYSSSDKQPAKSSDDDVRGIADLRVRLSQMLNKRRRLNSGTTTTRAAGEKIDVNIEGFKLRILEYEFAKREAEKGAEGESEKQRFRRREVGDIAKQAAALTNFGLLLHSTYSGSLLAIWARHRHFRLLTGQNRYANTRGMNDAATEGLVDSTPPQTLSQRKQRKIELIDSLLQSLDSLTLVEISVLYYLDASTALLILRVLSQSFFVRTFPGPLEILPQAPPLIFANALCLLTHLIQAQPSSDVESSKGYIHGGLLVDFVGELGPVSKWRLFALDIFIFALQMIMLVCALEKYTPKKQDENAGGVLPGQDHDAEEAGLLRVQEEHRPETRESADGVELQSLMAGSSDDSTDLRTRNFHPTDHLFSGDVTLVELNMTNGFRTLLRRGATSGSNTVTGSVDGGIIDIL